MQSGFNFNELVQEAKNRWLKPAEVLFILQNYENYPITSEPPQKPQSGSLFLFNRRILRFFRKDGHIWRKKRDGRTVGEAHERLKVGNIDALNCYYAHGERNPNFQRRSYWMLDRDHDHIVLVHYREVAEGRHTTGPVSNFSIVSSPFGSEINGGINAQNTSGAPGTTEVYESCLSSYSSGSVEEVSSRYETRSDEVDHLNDKHIFGDFGSSSSKPNVNQTLRRLTEQLSLGDDYDSLYYGAEDEKPQEYGGGGLQQDILVDLLHGLEYPEQNPCLNDNSSNQDDLNINLLLQNADDRYQPHSEAVGPGYTIERSGSPSWKEVLELCSTSSGVHSEGKNTSMLTMDAIQSDRENNEAIDTDYYPASESNSTHLSAARQFLLGTENPVVLQTPNDIHQEAEEPNLSTYSVGAGACEIDSGAGRLGKTNSIGWMETKHIVMDNSNYSSEYQNMWFNQENDLRTLGADLGLTVAQIQRFSIREISPEWAYSTEGSKVIITGDFLCDPSMCVWHCMFGDIEVPVEIIQKGVLRCQAPPHASGKISLCITSGNRESCSEVREFDYRLMPHSYPADNSLPHGDSAKSTEELLLLVRLAEMILHRNNSLLEHKEDSAESRNGSADSWEGIIDSVLAGIESPSSTMDWLLQEILKLNLEQWLSSKCREGELSDCSLTKQEQGIIHTIAGLGYEWALPLLLNSGVGINFRDMQGWTALHWAARFGREKMVAALLAAGASPGAVTDPTSKDPVGKTPASIAADNGHKGLAAYLSEVLLTSHLSLLTLGECEIAKGTAAIEAEQTVGRISERSSLQLFGSATEDQLSLKDSLEAVRNATQAAARIQSAFRAHSFMKRQQHAASTPDEYGMTLNDIHGISAAFRNQRDHKLDKAAVSIQKKYRGWKGRKEFLFIRQNVVKIQAIVRGHQVRKKYKEVLWTVGVLEKVVLRWRRKGVGLRGFRAEAESIDENEDDDILKVFRKQKVDKAVDQALTRVLSMVDSPKARHQYRRMLESYRQAKAGLSSNVSEASSDSRGFDDMQYDGDDFSQFI